jgi:hypothetical protein
MYISVYSFFLYVHNKKEFITCSYTTWCFNLLYVKKTVMLCYAEPLDVNHGVLYWASGYESLWVMLSQRLRIMVYHTEPVVVNHCQLCWASDCESLCVILCQYVWTMVSYAEP